MNRCLQLANNGIGITRPNPSVGAVIVYKDKIIGEGFTSKAGDNHAEVNAINSVKDKKLLRKSTIYVTLEPCSHFGKTPPCADLIVSCKFKRVVIGCLDSNPKVAGRGVKRLLSANIQVKVGVLEQMCREQHKRFFTNQEQKRPYIILKWAETKDGFLAPSTKDIKKPFWISNTYSQQLVHKLRAKENAILVGKNTVLEDNPTLNVRSWFGENPVRVVIDNTLELSDKLNVFNNEAKTIIFTGEKKLSENNLIYEQIDFNKPIAKQICSALLKHQIQSLIIEGGAKTLQTFINENLWDEAKVFVGDVTLKKGLKAPKLKVKETIKTNIFNDFLKTFHND